MRSPAILFTAMVALLLALLYSGHDDTQRNDVAADDYTRIVDDVFIARDWLRLQSPQDPDESERDQPQPLTLKLDLTKASPQEKQLATQFSRTSYLLSDIERFNAPRSGGDYALFDYTRGRLNGIDPRAHQFRLPYRRSGRWEGRLQMREKEQEQGIWLRSTDESARRLTITPSTRRSVNAEGEAKMDLFNPHIKSAEGDSILFIHQGREVARLWRIADELVLRPIDAGPKNLYSIGINGRQVGLREGANIYRVTADSVLYFEYTGTDGCNSAGRCGVAWMRDAGEAESIYDGKSGVWQEGQRQPFLANVVTTLDAAAVRLGKVIDDDVILTILPKLDNKAREILFNAVKVKRDTDIFALEKPRSAITIMDAMSGELLALPSFPQADHVKARNDFSRPDPWLDNHNFDRNPPGSVAKILFAAALLDADPGLRHLRIAPHTSVTTVLGIPTPGLGGATLEAEVDFISGMARSLNKYAATLLTLGSRHPDAISSAKRTIASRQDYFSLSPGEKGALQRERPEGLLFEPDAGFRVEQVRKLPWVRRMTDLYGIYTGDEALPAGVSADQGSATHASPQQDLPATRHYVWRNLPPALAAAFEGADAHRLDPISPAYENLGMDKIDRRDEFRTHYLPLILGGSESRWTNIELAEAFASLVRNETVAASLVVGGGANVRLSKRRGGWSKLDPEVHQLLADAMRAAVLGEGGTATRLRGVLRSMDEQAQRMVPPQTLALFAKTGTPELQLTERSPAAEIFDRMAADGVFRRDGSNGLVLYRGLALIPADLPTFNKARESELFKQDIENYFGNSVESRCGYYKPYQLWSAVFRDLVAAHNMVRDEKLRQARQLVTADGALASTATCEVGGEAFGRAIVFVAALYDRKALRYAGKSQREHLDVVNFRPNRAVSVAITFQDRVLKEKSKRVHLETAIEILDKPVRTYLELGASQK